MASCRNQNIFSSIAGSQRRVNSFPHSFPHRDPEPPGRGAWLRLGREMPAEPCAYAAKLYDALHRLDAAGFEWIAMECPPDTPEWAGVRDRLRRASH